MNKHITDRREFLRLAGLAAAVGAALPLQAFPAQAATAGSVLPADPDQLFLRGWFDAADRGYAQQLRQDPDNEHALAQRGYIALLSGRLGAAEAFLTRAIQLNPNDTFPVGKLADCYLRQDQFARAVPLLRQTGNASDTAQAAQFAAVGGVPYQVRGARSTRVPIVSIDPLPIIEASLNGGSPQPFIFDTGATTPGFSNELAAELGLTPVSSTTGDTGSGQVTLNFGWLKSFQVGEIELRNIPVQWGNTKLPAPPGGPVPVGALGTVFMFHFLTTLDYAGKGFVLRRKTEGRLREFQAAASRDGYRPLPLWLADTRNGAPLLPLHARQPQQLWAARGLHGHRRPVPRRRNHLAGRAGGGDHDRLQRPDSDQWDGVPVHPSRQHLAGRRGRTGRPRHSDVNDTRHRPGRIPVRHHRQLHPRVLQTVRRHPGLPRDEPLRYAHGSRSPLTPDAARTRASGPPGGAVMAELTIGAASSTMTGRPAPSVASARGQGQVHLP